MRTRRFIAFLSGVLLVGCDFTPPKPTSVPIADVTKTNELTVVSIQSGYLPHTISLWLTGRIDGTARITFTERTETMWVSGDVRWQMSYDFFRTSGVFGYYPTDVKTGHLTLQYLYR